MADTPALSAKTDKIPGNRKKNRFFRKFAISVAFLLVVAISLWVLSGTVFHFSKGFREGYVYKFSNKGYVFKTWEGILKTGFINFNNVSTPNEEWSFSVTDKNVINVLNNTDQRQYVKLYYKEYYTRLFWRGDTRYFIYKIDTLK